MGAISRLLGIATAGVMLYNAGARGSRESTKMQTAVSANRISDEYYKSMRMDGYDEFGNSLKKTFFGWSLGWGLPEFKSSIKGFVGGAVSSLSDNIIPAVLATGAILSKGRFSKVCGVGLLISGVQYVATNIMGIGKPKSPLGYKS